MENNLFFPELSSPNLWTLRADDPAAATQLAGPLAKHQAFTWRVKAPGAHLASRLMAISMASQQKLELLTMMCILCQLEHMMLASQRRRPWQDHWRRTGCRVQSTKEALVLTIGYNKAHVRFYSEGSSTRWRTTWGTTHAMLRAKVSTTWKATSNTTVFGEIQSGPGAA